MKTIRVDLNDKLAENLDALVREGFFKTEQEVLRFALIEFIESHKPALLERFQREDIAWALKQERAS